MVSSDSFYGVMSEDFTNNGTLATNKTTYVSANNTSNNGKVKAGVIGFEAQNDITNTNTLIATRGIAIKAGGNVNLNNSVSQASAQDAKSSQHTDYISQQAKVIIGEAGSPVLNGTTFSINAGKNINVNGAQIQNFTGDSLLDAKQNVNFNALTLKSDEKHQFAGRDFVSTANTTQIGSQLYSAGNIGITGENINGVAANIQAGKQVNLQANQDISLSNGMSTHTGNSYVSKGKRDSKHKAKPVLQALSQVIAW